MLLKEFINHVVERLKILSKNDPAYLDLLVRIESKVASTNLKAILSEGKFNGEDKSAGDEEANEVTLAPFIFFLKTRWEFIRLTDANYCHAPSSLASRACYILADEIASAVNTSRAHREKIPIPANKQPYDYLMPTVDANKCRTSRGNLHNLNLNEFIFADLKSQLILPPSPQSVAAVKNLTMPYIREQDVGEPIEVKECLKNACDTTYSVLHTTCISSRHLNASEEARIDKHSLLSEEINSKLKSTDRVYRDDVERMMKEDLKNNPIVRSSYGMEGKIRLLAVIMSNCENISNFAQMLAHFVDRSEWNSFLSAHGLGIELLRDVLLNKKTFKEIVNSADIYYLDNSYNAAVLFSLTYLYKKDREKEGDYKTSYGWLLFASNKHEKIDAADFLLKYLSSDLKQSFNEYLEAHSKAYLEAHPGIDSCRWLAAMNNGDLGEIKKAIENRIKRIDLQLDSPCIKYGSK